MKPDGKNTLCFPASTTVRMADGSQKYIVNVVPGDKVMSVNLVSREVSESIVTRITSGEVEQLITINHSLTASPRQTLLSGRGLTSFEDLAVGDYIFSFPSLLPQLVHSVETNYGNHSVYNLTVENFATFFADDFLVEDQDGLPSTVSMSSKLENDNLDAQQSSQ